MQDAYGIYKLDEHFLPMNLCWSHSAVGVDKPEVFAEGISPHMGKHCDLGRILEPNLRKTIGEYPKDTMPENNCLALELEVKPNTRSHLIQVGNYKMEIKIAASNAKPVVKWLEISLKSKWYADEKSMFTDGITVKQLRGA